MTITPGENVGPYRVIEQLGSGGMATVFKAYHPSLDRYVAIKVLHPAFKADPQFFERFKREARIVAKLEHPNIIPVYDFNEHKGEPYLVMRFIQGDTLKPTMKGKPMPPAEILRLMRPVCQALAYAHKQGVLHRDIKPSNIMVTKERAVFVTDFGLARMVQAGESTLSQDMMVGTPQYISPEQAQGIGDLDGRTDIYSMGVVLFEMLTGKVPFSADTPFATIHDHIYSPLPLPSSINPDIDPAVERMLLKALAKNPDDRFATIDELLTALETTLGGQIAEAPTVQTAPEVSPAVGQKKSGMPWWVWAGSVALAVCVIGGLLAGLLLLRRANRNAASSPVDQTTPVQLADSDQPRDGGQAGNPPPGQEPVQPGNPPPGDQPVEPGNPSPLPGDQPVEPGNPSPPPEDRPALGDFDSNSPEFQQAAELSQQALDAVERGQLDEAIRLYQQALETAPHYLPAYVGLSQALKRKGDEEGSITVLEEAVASNPKNPAAYLRLGEAYLLDQNSEAALETFEKASQLAPDAPMPYAGQALALLALDRNAEAKQAIDTALSLDPFSPEARLANAVYLGKQGNRQAALQELRQLIRDQRVSIFVKEHARQLLNRLGG